MTVLIYAAQPAPKLVRFRSCWAVQHHLERGSRREKVIRCLGTSNRTVARLRRDAYLAAVGPMAI